MSKIYATGSSAPVRQATEVSFDPASGLRVVEHWEGYGLNCLNSLANGYQNLAVPYQLTRGLKSTLIATASSSAGGTGADDVTTDTWQVVANEVHKDLREHPKFLALIDPLKEQIGDALGKSPLTKPSKMTPALTGDALRFYNLMYLGVTHFPVCQYVLRHTTNCSNRYSKNISDTNVGCIYTTKELTAECMDRSLWVFPLPGRLQSKLDGLPSSAAADFLWGWRKLPSTETTAANNRIEISTEFELDLWSLLLYDPVPPPKK